MYYDIESNLIYVRYDERKKNKTTSYHFEGTPIFLQLNPLKPSVVDTVHFNVPPPDWMKVYASINRIDFHTAFLEGEGEGFSLTNINDDYTSSAFTMEGKIQDWFKQASVGYTEIKDELLANSDIVENNLRYYPELFDSYGLKIRPSEFDTNYFSINFREIAPNRNIDSSNLPHDSEERERKIELINQWTKLKNDLITVRDYPISSYEDNSVEVASSEPSVDIEMPVIAAPSIDIEVPVIAAPSIDIEMPVITAPSIDIEMPAIVAPSIDIEVPVIADPSIDIEMPAIVSPLVEVEIINSVTTEERTKTKITDQLIVKKPNKKAGLISGQVLLF